MKETHFEKEEYPGGFQVESLCGVKAVFCSEGDCMVTSKDVHDYMTYSELSMEEIIICNKCRKLYLKGKRNEICNNEIRIW